MEALNVDVHILDSISISGGVICSRVELGFLDNKKPIMIDFLSINVYGVGIYDKTLKNVKTHGTLCFPFLQDERTSLLRNQDLFLIFSSDPCVFCIGKQLNSNYNKLSFIYKCTIPPFIPLTFQGKYLTFKYYVYTTVQYRNLESNKPSIFSKRVKFNVLGSIYSDVPVLDFKHYPFLPKAKNTSSDLCEIASDIMHNNHADTMYFHYGSSIISLLEDSPGDEVLNDSNGHAVCDLNVIGSIYDCIDELEHKEDVLAIDVLYYYNNIVKDFKKMVDEFSKDRDESKIERLRCWFGDILSTNIYDKEYDRVTETIRKEAVRVFFNDIEERVSTFYNKSFEALNEIIDNRAIVSDKHSNNEEFINFSYCGNNLCTCDIKGLTNDFEIMVNCELKIFFDFKESQHQCVCVDVNISVVEDFGALHSKMVIVSKKLITLGKIGTTFTVIIPHDATPSFSTPFGNISHSIEIIFYCFHNYVNLLDQQAFKNELNKLKMVKWSKPIKILQDESLRLHTRNIINNKTSDDNKKLYYNRTRPKTQLI